MTLNRSILAGRKTALLLSTAVLLAACGGPAPGAPTNPEELAAAVAEAGGVAGVAGAQVNCPPKVATQPAAGPAYDILGVRPGMTYDEAVNVLRCADNKLAAKVEKVDIWRINYSGLDTRRGFVVEAPLTPEEENARLKEIKASYTGGGSGEDPFGVKPGKVRYTASTVGVPGDERVIHFLSEQVFALDALPAIESLVDTLKKKYGEPSSILKMTNYRGKTMLFWVRDASGAPIPPNASQEVQYETRMCRLTTEQYPLEPVCSSLVTAEIEPSEKNPEIATKLKVVSVLSDWGYKHLEMAEAELARIAKEKNAAEAEKAKGNAEAPKL